ncbi:MAG: hypothetical protein ABSG93_14480 [Solirubrobacteraceae bacterium]|jgi:hypothetical protein
MQTNPTPDPAERLDRIEQDVLYLLTGMKGEQPIWSIEDLGREVEHAEDADIACRGLQQAGLIYRTSDGHVFASRAGVRAVQMSGHVI